jgi:hypothetical protein
MPESKSKPKNLTVHSYLAEIEDESRQRECKIIAALITKVTKLRPRMWGNIVGYGSYHYKYPSGREGDAPRIGFASRKGNIAIYLMASGKDQDKLLAKLGKHKMGGSCLTFKRLEDIDFKVLEKLVVGSLAETKRRHPK